MVHGLEVEADELFPDDAWHEAADEHAAEDLQKVKGSGFCCGGFSKKADFA